MRWLRSPNIFSIAPAFNGGCIDYERLSRPKTEEDIATLPDSPPAPDRSGRARRRDARLLPDSSGARGSRSGDARRQCVVRRRRGSADEARARSAAHRAVRQLSEGTGVRRSRNVASHQPTGGGGDSRTTARNLRTGSRGHDSCHPGRRTAWHHRRSPCRHPDRSRRDDACPGRNLDAKFLAGAASGDRVFGDARLAASLRTGYAGASGAAGDHACCASRCHSGPDDARQRHRGIARTVRCSRHARGECRARAPCSSTRSGTA